MTSRLPHATALGALAACVALAPRQGGGQAAAADVVDSASHLFRGDRSGFADAARLVVRDAEAWRRVWATLAVGRPDTLAPPAIDFRREIVIVAALGARTTAGFQLAIETVRRGQLVVEAVVLSVEPGPACPRTFAIVQPVDVVRVPRTERPVTFVERQAVMACERR